MSAKRKSIERHLRLGDELETIRRATGASFATIRRVAAACGREVTSERAQLAEACRDIAAKVPPAKFVVWGSYGGGAKRKRGGSR